MNVKVAKSELFIGIFCFVFIGILAVMANFLWLESKRFTENSTEQHFDVLQKEFENQLSDVILDARAIAIQESNSILVGSALRDNEAKAYLASHWNALFTVYPALQQIRYISVDGDEKLRAERSSNQLVWQNTDDLQNKGNRYYFVEAVMSDTNYYISPIDLNKERSVIELPFRPTIRSIAKYYIDGTLDGLVVLNFDLSRVFFRLNELQKESEYWLINPNGFYLASPNNTAWGWLLDKPENQVSAQFPGFLPLLEEGNKTALTDTFLDRNKYGQVPIGKNGFEDTHFSESSYWLVMGKPGETHEYLVRSKYYILIGFIIAALFMVALAFLLIRLFKQLKREKEQAVEAKIKATEAEKAKADFLARMSHEIRTPMNGVYGLLQITQGERNYKKINGNLENAITSFSLLSRIIDDVLDFSKIEAGKLEIVDIPFRLDSLLNQVGQMMGRAAYGKHIELWIDVDPNCPTHVVGDPVRLNQILSNLISNAIKFTSRGEVNLRVELLSEDSNTVQLGFDIQDTGIGMTKEQAAQVFSAFTQATRDTNSKFGGTGLGLSIAKQLVELMRGKIGVESEKGVGSTFHFNVVLHKATQDDVEKLGATEIVSYQAIIFTRNINAEAIMQRQCSVLGWPSYAAKTIDELKSHETSITLPRVLLIDEAIIERIDAKALGQWQAQQKDIVHLVIVSHNRKDFGEESLVLHDDLLLKPFTPSTLYDAVIACTQQPSEDSQFPSAIVEAEAKVLAKTLILVVEDNPINQQVAGAMLKGAGAIVKFAENGQECLDLLNNNLKPHLILMDMQMPIMGGVEAAENMRKNSDWDDIPIIAMTANAMESDKKRCIDAGMQSHIVKPVVKGELIALVKSRLGR